MNGGGNIFEFLDEGSAASKAHNQKKEKKPASTPAPAAAASAGKANAGKSAAPSNNRGRGGAGGARGGARGAGSSGRGRAGAPLAEKHEQDVAARSKDRERRNREQTHKRGDYGAPDQAGHVKRPYDKFSHSATGRFTKEGGRPKKDGKGAHNWGGKDVAPEDVAAIVEGEVKESEADIKQAEEDAAAAAAAREAEEKEIDYQEFLLRKKKEGEELKNIAPVEIRKVDNSSAKGLKVLKKEEESVDFGQVEEKKGGKAKKSSGTSRNSKVNVDAVLNVRAAEKPREGGRGRGSGGRGGSKPPGAGRGSGQRRQDANLSLADDNDFPTLGGAVKA